MQLRIDPAELEPLIRRVVAETLAASRPAEPEAGDGLATVEQAGEFLGVARSTVYELFADGTLTRVKIGRSVRIRWAELRELAERGTE